MAELTPTPLRIRLKVWLWQREPYARVATAIHVLRGRGVMRGLSVRGGIDLAATDRKILITGNTFTN